MEELNQAQPFAYTPNFRRAAGDIQQTVNIAATSRSICEHQVRGVWRIVYIGLAGLFFALGLIGIVLPGLPTTPFLLLCSYFLARSWRRMHQVLLSSPLIGQILRNWQLHRAVEPRIKRRATLLVCAVMALLIFFSKLPAAPLITVLALASVGLWVINRLPTFDHDAQFREEPPQEGYSYVVRSA